MIRWSHNFKTHNIITCSDAGLEYRKHKLKSNKIYLQIKLRHQNYAFVKSAHRKIAFFFHSLQALPSLFHSLQTIWLVINSQTFRSFFHFEHFWLGSVCINSTTDRPTRLRLISQSKYVRMCPFYPKSFRAEVTPLVLISIIAAHESTISIYVQS